MHKLSQLVNSARNDPDQLHFVHFLTGQVQADIHVAV